MTVPPGGARRAPRWPWLASAVVVLVTAGVLLVAKLTGDDYETPVGKVTYTGFSLPQGYDADVRLPFGRLAVRVTKPQSSIHDDPEIATRPAPDGGSFIGLSARFVQQYALFATASAETVSPRFSLLIGGRRYPVPGDPLEPATAYPYSSLPSAWVAVDGSPADVRVGVEYDGVRQVIDPKRGTRTNGLAAPLYSHPADSSAAKSARTCGAPTLTSGYRAQRYAGLTCEYVPVSQLPYVTGLGWAPQGKSWLSLTIVDDRYAAVTWRGNGGHTADYHSVDDDVTGTFRVDGNASRGDAATNRTSSLAPGFGQLGFFLVDSSTTSLTADVSVTFRRLVNEDDTPAAADPVDPTVRATWKVAVPNVG